MYDFVEESFKIEDTFEYILSIQVSLNGFSFSVFQPNRDKILVFKSIPLKISGENLIARRFKEWVNSEELLQKTFQKTRVIVFSNKFTLVPKSIYKNELNEELAHLFFREGNQLQFAENLVEKINAKLLFNLPEGLNDALQETIGECDIIHPIKSVISNISDKEGEKLVLLFNDKYLFLLLSKNEKLLLANGFKINHENDVVYYVLTTLKQFDIQAKHTKLFYAGQSAYSSQTSINLGKYFFSVELFLPLTFDQETKPSDELIAENFALYL